MRSLLSSVTVVFVLGVLGCEKEEQKERSAEPAASVDKASAIDPALAKAMAQASAAGRPKKGPVAAAGGPPPNGIFESGAADREARPGAAPKITLGDRGKEPRIVLGPAQPKPGWKGAGNVQVMLQGNDPRQPPLPVQIALTLEAQKPKAVADAGADAVPSGVVAVTARVKSAELAAPGVPQELVAKFQALKGVKIEYLVAPDGSGTGYRYELPAAASELTDYLRALSDTLALVTLPTPSEPLGPGGFWMTTSREGVYGLDLVTYRMVKVEKVDGDQVTLTVGTKRYATSDRFEFAGLPPDVPKTLLEFDAKSEGRLEFKAGSPFPSGGEVGSLLAARVGSEQQAMMVQTQSRVGLSFPDKSSPAKPAATPQAPPPQAP